MRFRLGYSYFAVFFALPPAAFALLLDLGLALLGSRGRSASSSPPSPSSSAVTCRREGDTISRSQSGWHA